MINPVIGLLRKLAGAILTLALCTPSGAHEVRPAYLEIEENAAGEVSVLWKQPVLGDVAVPLRPALSSGWLDPEATSSTYTPTYLTQRWLVPPPRAPLAGQRLAIEGLERSLTDVLVRIEFANGTESVHLVKPERPSLVLPSASRATPPVAHYLALGIEHIWTGVDHLLFVLGLMLLATRFVDLLKTITAFTLAHSITLAAAALEAVSVPSAPVEAVIALSIVYLAVELVRARQGQPGIAVSKPWLIALAFGLLHGFGFAGALSEVGLPADRIPSALLLFNIGIELGQVAFVGAVFLVQRGLRSAHLATSVRLGRAIPHVIGSLAAFWFIERTVAALA